MATILEPLSKEKNVRDKIPQLYNGGWPAVCWDCWLVDLLDRLLLVILYYDTFYTMNGLLHKVALHLYTNAYTRICFWFGCCCTNVWYGSLGDQGSLRGGGARATVEDAEDDMEDYRTHSAAM